MDRSKLVQRMPVEWKKQTTYRVYPFWYWRDEMPVLEDILLKCVFYLYPSEDDANQSTEYGGSGFFLGVQSGVNENRGYLYAITNSHCVFDPDMQSVVIRINTKEGKFRNIPTEKDDWTRHPDGDDLAVYNIGLKWDTDDFGMFKRDHILTDEFLEGQSVGPGDEVFMIGRFQTYSGKKRNLPTARFGNIAAMPEEPLLNPFTGLPQESFIVEMRSISGFSGSPVVLYFPPMTPRPQKGPQRSMSFGSMQRLLGINWGHIPVWEKAEDEQGKKFKVRANSAMAGVVPSWKILDIIDSDEMKEERRLEDEKLKEEIADAPIVLDTQDKDSEFTRDDMENALKKVARQVKKQDDEEK